MNHIGVIVYGQLREFEIAQKSWGFLKKLNCDFYFSTWNMSYNNHHINESSVVYVNEEIIKKYFPNSTISIIDEKSFDENWRNQSQLKNSKKMIYHWKNGIKLIKNSGIEYSQIILKRFDMFYELKNVDEKRIYDFKEINTIYNNRFGIKINQFNNYTIDDQFFIGNYHVMNKFIENLDYKMDMNVHDFLAKKLIDLGIESKSLEHDYFNDMCVVRPNVREVDEKDINIHMINEKFKNW